MKTPRQKQDGFSLISVMLGLSLASIIMVGVTNTVVDQLNKRNAREFRAHAERVISQIQQYQYFMVTEQGVNPTSPTTFPENLEGLMFTFPDQFWPRCTEPDENNGLCKRPDGLPWSTQKLGYELTFSGVPSLPSVNLTFPLSNRVIPAEYRALWAGELQRLPFSQLMPNGDITVKIYDPLIMSVYKEFLKRDGSVQLTDAWDVGNQSILNAKSISIQTQDGRQQRLDVGTVSEFLAHVSADRIAEVNKSSWSCAQGLTQTIHVSVNTIMAPKDISIEYIGTSGFSPFAIDNDTHWTLGLTYNAKIKSTGKWEKMTEGILNVRLNCSVN